MPRFAQRFAKIGQMFANICQSVTKLGECRTNFGPNRSSLLKLCRIRATVAQTRFADNGRFLNRWNSGGARIASRCNSRDLYWLSILVGVHCRPELRSSRCCPDRRRSSLGAGRSRRDPPHSLGTMNIGRAARIGAERTECRPSPSPKRPGLAQNPGGRTSSRPWTDPGKRRPVESYICGGCFERSAIEPAGAGSLSDAVRTHACEHESRCRLGGVLCILPPPLGHHPLRRGRVSLPGCVGRRIRSRCLPNLSLDVGSANIPMTFLR